MTFFIFEIDKFAFKVRKMDNPFEIIITRLKHIEDMLSKLNIAKDSTQLSPAKSTSDFLTVSQSALYLSVSRATIYRYTAERIIPHFKSGKRLYFKRSDLEAWVTAHRVSSNEEISEEVENYLIRKKRYRH